MHRSLLGFTLLSSAIGSSAFVTLNVAPRCTTNLFEGGNGGDEENASFDVENARRRLENMLSDPEKIASGNNSSNDGDSDLAAAATPFSFSKFLADNDEPFSLSALPPPPPLSTIERSRRLVEIKLIECLNDGDDVISELWDHWYSERGSAAKQKLQQSSGMFMDESKWEECEQNLIELVVEHGIYFAEPVNLLATLYFIQKRFDLSYKLCQVVLAIKPHHIGALSGIVEVALGSGDMGAARYWAAKRLPKHVPASVSGSDGAASVYDENEDKKSVDTPRRVEWVQKAVARAQDTLDQAERRTKQKFFGEADIHFDDSGGGDTLLDGDDDGDAWQ